MTDKPRIIAAVPGALRANLAPWTDTPLRTDAFLAEHYPQTRGLPDGPYYGDRMTPEVLHGWALSCLEEETKRLGRPAFRRSLVPDLDVVACADGNVRAADFAKVSS